MYLHRFGYHGSDKKTTVDGDFDKKYLDLRLRGLREDIERAVTTKITETVTKSLGESTAATKSYLDSLSDEIKTISANTSNKVDRVYLNERLDSISNKIKDNVEKNILNKVDKQYLDVRIQQLIREINQERRLDDKKLSDFESEILATLNTQLINKQLFGEQLSAMGNKIKEDLSLKIHKFISRDEMNKLSEEIKRDYALNSFLDSELDKLETKLQAELERHKTDQTSLIDTANDNVTKINRLVNNDKKERDDVIGKVKNEIENYKSSQNKVIDTIKKDLSKLNNNKKEGEEVIGKLKVELNREIAGMKDWVKEELRAFLKMIIPNQDY